MTKTVLALAYPKLAAEWHSEKNGKLTPKDVTCGSHKKVWWRCYRDASHEWVAEIKSRVSGNGCPICAGFLAIPATSLQALYPDIAAQWHSEKNNNLTPDQVRPGSEKKVWWRCQKNKAHEWSSIVSNRVKCKF